MFDEIPNLDLFETMKKPSQAGALLTQTMQAEDQGRKEDLAHVISLIAAANGVHMDVVKMLAIGMNAAANATPEELAAAAKEFEDALQ